MGPAKLTRGRRGFAASVLFMLSASLSVAGCGGGGGGGSDSSTSSGPTVESIQIESAPSDIPAHLSRQLTARAVYSNGDVRDVTADGSWSSSDTSAASVGADGLMTAQSAGDTVIRFAYQGAYDASQVTVVLGTPTSVTVEPSSSTLRFEETQALRAIGTFAKGVQWDITDAASWSSADPNSVTVDGGGVVSPVNAGSSTQVSAKWQGVTGSGTVAVSSASLDTLSVTASSGSIDLGDLTEGTVAMLKADATYTDTSKATVTADVDWSSSASDVVTVSNAAGAKGRIKAVAAGNAVITATLGTTSAQATVSVTAAPNAPDAVMLRPAPNMVLAGATPADTSRLVAQLVPNNADNGTIADGTQVNFAIVDGPGKLGASQAETSGGKAEVTFTPSSAGPTTVKVDVPATGISAMRRVYTVNSFAQAFGIAATSNIDNSGGVIHVGSQLRMLAVNISNRSFHLVGLTLKNGTKTLYDPITNPLQVPAASGVDTGKLEISNQQNDNGLVISMDLKEPKTGESFYLKTCYTQCSGGSGP